MIDLTNLRDLPPVDVCDACEGKGVVPSIDRFAPVPESAEPIREDCDVCGGTGRDPSKSIDLPERLSVTLLKHDDRCPRSAWLYLKFKGGPSSHEQARGTAFHEAAERATKAIIEYGSRADEVGAGDPEHEDLAPADAKVILEEVLRERSDLVVPALERDALRGMVWNWAEHYAPTLKPDRILGAEVMLTWEVAGFVVRGKIDLVYDDDGVCRIDDYKTAFPPSKDDTSKDAVQLMLYACLVAFGVTDDGDAFGAGFDAFDVGTVYPRVVRDDGTLSDRRMQFDRKRLAEIRIDVETQLVRLREQAESGKWPAVPGPAQCGECPAAHECPLPVQYRPESEAPTTIEDAVRLAEWHYLMKRQLERVKRKLKRFVEAEGQPVPVGDDLILGFRVSTGTSLKRKVEVPGEKKKVDGQVALRFAIDDAVAYGRGLTDDGEFPWDDFVEAWERTNFDYFKPETIEGKGTEK